jgi:diadenosine tetraphosphate (Ap4A) HIT family hydrolase
MISCAICDRSEGEMIWSDNIFRVVLLDHQDYRGYCRVELIDHKKEMTDLDEALRSKLMRCVFKVEEILKVFVVIFKTENFTSIPEIFK